MSCIPSWPCAFCSLLGWFTLCECWAPAPYWRILCASGTPNSSRWAVGLSFYASPLCDGHSLQGTKMLTSDSGPPRCDRIHVSFGPLNSQTPRDFKNCHIPEGDKYFDRAGDEFLSLDGGRASFDARSWEIRMIRFARGKIKLSSSWTWSDIFGDLDWHMEKGRSLYMCREVPMSVSIVCLSTSHASQKLLTKAGSNADFSFTWTSQTDLSQAKSAWIGARFPLLAEASCVKILQLEGDMCADIVLQSSSDAITWFGELGQVHTEVALDGVATSLVMAGGNVARMSCPTNASCSSRDLRQVHDRPWSVSLLCIISLVVVILLVMCCPVTFCHMTPLPNEIPRLHRCDFSSATVVGKVFSPQEPEDESSTTPNNTKILKLTLVRHQGWFLKGTTLNEILQAHNSIVTVVSEQEALSSFPARCFRRMGVVAAFEAVVRVPAGHTSEEIGRMIHAALVQREQQCGRRLSTSGDQPSVQLTVSVRHTFLHFGGSIGCLHGRRWQSCPPRQHRSE